MFFASYRGCRALMLLRAIVVASLGLLGHTACGGQVRAQSGSLDNPWSVEPNRPYPKRTPTPPLVDPNPSRPSRPVP